MSVTGGAETAIGTSWQVPSGTKCIEGVRIFTAAATIHDAVLSVIPALRLYSRDLPGIEPCDILANPQGSSPVTHGNGNSKQRSFYYPLNIKCKGGETIYFYGRHMVTVTTAQEMTVNIYYSDNGGGQQYHYAVAGQIYATTVTAGAKHTDPTVYKINGTKITAVLGAVWQTTSTAAVGCIGKFGLESTDFKFAGNIEWGNEGGGGILSVGDLDVFLSAEGLDDKPLDLPINSNGCNIKQTFTNGPTNIVGAFITGVQFI